MKLKILDVSFYMDRTIPLKPVQKAMVRVITEDGKIYNVSVDAELLQDRARLAHRLKEHIKHYEELKPLVGETLESE